MSDYLDSAALADRLGIKVRSIHRMRSRGDLPDPDRVIGRSPAWRPSTIDRWQASRPGHGWRGRGNEDQAVTDVAPEPVDEPPAKPLPAGDIHFDGRVISVGGKVLTPGRYSIGDTGTVLEVEPDTDIDSEP